MMLTKAKIAALFAASLTSYAVTARHEATMSKPSHTLAPITITGAPIHGAPAPAPASRQEVRAPNDPCPCDSPDSLGNR